MVPRNPLNVSCALLLASLVLALPACGPMTLPESKTRITIEFGMYPEVFEGSDVSVDGKIVGKLEMTGQVTRRSFPVTKGTHAVCIENPRFDCEPTRVTLELEGQRVQLLADLEERSSDEGVLRQVIVLR